MAKFREGFPPHPSLNLELLIEHVRLRYPSLPPVHVYVKRDSSFNAGVDPNDDGSFSIFINDGVFLMSEDMFSAMLSKKDVFPEVGYSSLETGEDRKMSLYFDGSFDLAHFPVCCVLESGVIVCVKPEWPNDKQRHILAVFLQHHLVQYFLYHELCHIIRGHIGFGIKHPDKLKDIDIRQTLEMDADQFAVSRAITLWREMPQLVPEFHSFAHDLKTFCKFWSFAVYSAIKLMRTKPRPEERNFYHAPPKTRMSTIMSGMATILMNQWPNDYKESTNSIGASNGCCRARIC